MREANLAINRLAFLDTIAFSEGTWHRGDDGYNVLYGGTLFTGYADHPRQVILANGIHSSAAGRYQLLVRWFDAYVKQMGLEGQGFTPAVQDAIALQQIKERKALPYIDAGEFEPAILQCSTIWASFPGAPYGQPQKSMTTLKKFYIAQGGTTKEDWHVGAGASAVS